MISSRPQPRTPPHHLPFAPTPQEYRRLITRVRAILTEAVPQESTLLVVSKGDDEFVTLPDRTVWHFPRGATGGYAGFYPPNGDDAVTHLRSLEDAGAEYIAFPRTAFWWLDHYPEIVAYLNSSAALIAGDDVCRLYWLGAPPERPKPRALEHHAPTIAVIQDLVDRLLPSDAVVTMLVDESDKVGFDLGERQVRIITRERMSSLARLSQPQRATMGFLLLRATNAPPVVELGRLITRQQHVCTIYDLGANSE